MYQYKDLYTIDFRDVQNYAEVHLIIREALDFPDYYGCNWDAFWDCLTDMIGLTVHIRIFGLDVIERAFPGEAEIMVDILREFKHYGNDRFSDDIKIEIVKGNIVSSIY